MHSQKPAVVLDESELQTAKLTSIEYQALMAAKKTVKLTTSLSLICMQQGLWTAASRSLVKGVSGTDPPVMTPEYSFEQIWPSLK